MANKVGYNIYFSYDPRDSQSLGAAFLKSSLLISGLFISCLFVNKYIVLGSLSMIFLQRKISFPHFNYIEKNGSAEQKIKKILPFKSKKPHNSFNLINFRSR